MQKYKLIDWLETHASNHQVTNLIKLPKTKTEVFSYNKEHFLCVFTNNDISIFDTTSSLVSLGKRSWFEKQFTIIGNNKPCFFVYKKEFLINDIYQEIDYTPFLNMPIFQKHLKQYSKEAKLTEQLMNYLLL